MQVTGAAGPALRGALGRPQQQPCPILVTNVEKGCGETGKVSNDERAGMQAMGAKAECEGTERV